MLIIKRVVCIFLIGRDEITNKIKNKLLILYKKLNNNSFFLFSLQHIFTYYSFFFLLLKHAIYIYVISIRNFYI
jgi:hypothetical protein